MIYALVLLIAILIPLGQSWAHEPAPGGSEHPGCVQLLPEHLPDFARSLRFGKTIAEDVRELFGSSEAEASEEWDSTLGGDKEVVVEGLQSMTPNHGLHYGEITFRTGAANLDHYLMLRFRFASAGGSEPVLYSMAATTKADDSPSVCAPASSLADRLSEQKRPKSPPNLPRARAKETRYTCYPCTGEGRPEIVESDDGNVKVSFNGEQYPLRTVEYEMIVGK